MDSVRWMPIKHVTYRAIYDDLKDSLGVYACNSDETYGPWLTVWGAGGVPIIKSECRGKGTNNEEWSYSLALHKEAVD